MSSKKQYYFALPPLLVLSDELLAEYRFCCIQQLVSSTLERVASVAEERMMTIRNTRETKSMELIFIIVSSIF
jgi:hypothetical protein